MPQQYTNATDVAYFLNTQIINAFNLFPDDISISVIKCLDKNKQQYLHISVYDEIPYNEYTYAFEKACKIIRENIKNNCKTFMDIVSLNDAAGKQIIWIPLHSECKTLYDNYDEFDEYSSTI